MGYFHSASSWKCSALAWPRGRERAGVGRQGSSQRMQGPSPSLDKSLSIRESAMGGLGDAACLWQVPSWSGASWAAPTAKARLEDALALQGTPTQPRPELQVFLCRAAGLPEQHWRETLDKHGAHPAVAALEKPSSRAHIYGKSLHQSINSSPTDAAGNASPMVGELWEMELTPTPAPCPPHCLPPVSLSSTQQLCRTLEEPLPRPEASSAHLCLLCLPAEPGSRAHRAPHPGSQSFAAEILGLGERMGWVRGHRSGLGG